MLTSRKIVYSLRVFMELQERGINPMATSQNPFKDKFICWIYDKTPEFDAAFDAIMLREGRAK